MKNYYKILGLRKTASEEEIRARWIELMRKFHPDGGGEGGSEDQRSKEINEAYQVLKHSSTRVEYDLAMAYHRKMRSLYPQRRILLPSILFVVIMLGLIYLPRLQIGPLSKPIISSAIYPIGIKVNPPSSSLADEQNPANLLNDLNKLNEPNKPNKLKKPKELNPVNRIRTSSPVLKLEKLAKIRKAVPLPKRLSNPNHLNEPNQLNDPSATMASAPLAKSETSATAQEAVLGRNQPYRADNFDDPIHPKARDYSNQSNKTEEPDLSGDSPVAHLLVAPGLSTEVKGRVAQATSSSPIVGEDEVRQFFVTYAERYTQKDIDGFILLFSSKAVQNGRDGLDEIKRIYSNFFDQSYELRYHLEDTRIQIYHNAVEARARYQVDQILKKGRKKKVWKGDVHWVLVRENGALKVLFLDYQNQKSS